MPKIQCKIRNNTLSVKQIILHYEECGISLMNLTLEEYARKLKTHAELIELWHGENLVGLCAFYMNDFDSRVAYIAHIAVVESFRGEGLGTYLILHVEHKAKSNGFDYMQLEVNNDNVAALMFYKKMQYELKEGRKDKMLLQKEL